MHFLSSIFYLRYFLVRRSNVVRSCTSSHDGILLSRYSPIGARLVTGILIGSPFFQGEIRTCSSGDPAGASYLHALKGGRADTCPQGGRQRVVRSCTGHDPSQPRRRASGPTDVRPVTITIYRIWLADTCGRRCLADRDQVFQHLEGVTKASFIARRSVYRDAG